MKPSFSSLVLAAGKGTRMKSALPKVLHQACGRSLLAHVLDSAAQAGATSHFVVTGTGRDEVLAELSGLGLPTVDVWQKEQKGTGHAVQAALPYLAKGEDTLLIMAGDAPLLKPETISGFLENHRAKKADLSLGTMELEQPFGYGRVVLDKKGSPRAIVEEKEASAKEKKIRTVNGGLYAVSRKTLEQLLPRLKESKLTGELYLTDIIALALKAKKKLAAFSISPEEMSGVNDLVQLQAAEEVLRKRIVERWMRDGVRVRSPQTLWVDSRVTIEAGCELGPNLILRGNTALSSGAKLEGNSVLIDSRILEGAEVKAFSHLENVVLRKGASAGPFARLRPGADLGEGAKIGNFVEVKKSVIGKGSKVSHLSYVGDAQVGSDVNIGCGFIACNYDGVNKHVTTILDGAFVGSGVQAVAPVTIGKDSYVATGSTINRDVPDGALGIARVKQENKEGYAEKLRGRMKAQKTDQQNSNKNQKSKAET